AVDFTRLHGPLQEGDGRRRRDVCVRAVLLRLRQQQPQHSDRRNDQLLTWWCDREPSGYIRQGRPPLATSRRSRNLWKSVAARTASRLARKARPQPTDTLRI